MDSVNTKLVLISKLQITATDSSTIPKYACLDTPVLMPAGPTRVFGVHYDDKTSNAAIVRYAYAYYWAVLYPCAAALNDVSHKPKLVEQFNTTP